MKNLKNIHPCEVLLEEFLLPLNIRVLLSKYRDCFVPRNDATISRHCEGRIDRSNLAKRSHSPRRISQLYIDVTKVK